MGITRRDLLKGLAAGAALGSMGLATRKGRADEPSDPRFLIVIGCFGGASLIDATLAIKKSESRNPDTVNCFDDSLVTQFDGSPLRAVDLDRAEMGPIPQAFKAVQSDFVRKHKAEMMVSTWTRTSVNHFVGQQRAVTGNDAWRGRTLQEVVAHTYGQSFALPNVHLVGGVGYTTRGLDGSLPAWAFGEQVADPTFWPLSLDGVKGVRGAPDKSLVEKARALRDRLEAKSTFTRVFADSPRLLHWQHLRGDPVRAIEAQNLVDKLMLVKDGPKYPLSEFGLSSSPDAVRLLETFPNLQSDPLEAQAAMAFLLLKNRLSVTVTLGPSSNVAIADGVSIGGGGLPEGSIRNPPISFDFSHQAHRSVQSFMWHRVYRVADKLIGLLKEEEWGEGQSMWDRSLIYLASDFGRTKNRPANADEFGTGHHLNNGVVSVSPLVNGNKVLGGVNPDTALTYGFDPRTGAPDAGREMEEREIYAGLVQAMGVDTTGSGLPDMPAMRKG